MKRILIIFRRDYREIVTSTAFKIILIVSGVITLGLCIGVPIAIHLQDWYGDPEFEPLLVFIVGLILYFLPLLFLLAFTWGFSGLQITKEKVNGNMECLAATPMTPIKLWTGKCLAVFAPGYAVAFITTLIVFLVINLSTAVPGWGTFMFPAEATLVALVANPLLFFAVLGFIILISLTGNPDLAITPSFLIGFGLMIGIPAGLATGWIDIMSWSFVLWYTAGAAVFWIIDIALMKRLTRQNIVLSSKGS